MGCPHGSLALSGGEGGGGGGGGGGGWFWKRKTQLKHQHNQVRTMVSHRQDRRGEVQNIFFSYNFYACADPFIRN